MSVRVDLAALEVVEVAGTDAGKLSKPLQCQSLRKAHRLERDAGLRWAPHVKGPYSPRARLRNPLRRKIVITDYGVRKVAHWTMVYADYNDARTQRRQDQRASGPSDRRVP